MAPSKPVWTQKASQEKAEIVALPNPLRDILSQLNSPASAGGLTIAPGAADAPDFACFLAEIPVEAPEEGLSFKQTLLWAQGSPAGASPFGAVDTLIRGVYARFPQHARSLLRNRLFLARPPGSFHEGLMKIAAKRWSPLEALELPGDCEALELLAPPSPASPHRAWLDLETQRRGALVRPDAVFDFLRDLRARLPWDRTLPRHARDRDIVALLLSSQGAILASDTNHQAHSRLEHAELRLARAWWHANQAPFPAGSQLWVTLEPCRMCAGALVESLAAGPAKATEHRPSLEIFYLERETGPSARHAYFEGQPIRCTQYTSAASA